MKNFSLFTLLILLVSCNNSAINNKIETIKAEPTGDQSLFFSEFVKNIELVPLENQKEAYLSDTPDFSINKYSLDGDFIEKKTFACKKYSQALKFVDEYLLYLNFGNGKRDERMVVMNEKGKEISAFLPINTKASPYFENNCLSVYSGNEALIREFYNDTIYSYSSKKGVTPRLIVDFGEKSLPKREYLESPGGRDNITRMQKKPGANIISYFESLGYDPYYRYIYAIKNKVSGLIRWFDFEQENSFLKTSFHFLEGDKLYCLVSPTHFDTMTDKFKALIKNPELLDKITPEDN